MPLRRLVRAVYRKLLPAMTDYAGLVAEFAKLT
jgi:hypothetical protein